METSPGNLKIKGLYSFTRAIGFNGDKTIKPFLSPVPSIKSLKVESSHACLIIGTKGLWNVLSYEKVADITNDLLHSYTVIILSIFFQCKKVYNFYFLF